ncbi:MAG TPA: hypothetical protein VFS41_06335, partial [Edaphobacter sp.]|nr:hypothetical protein [Edaphobacter sp.]
SDPDPHEPVDSQELAQTKTSQPEIDQLIAFFGSMLGLGSFFLLPLRYALLTVTVALLAVSLRVRNAKRWGAIGLALCAFIAMAIVWFAISGHQGPALDGEQTRATMRLEIVDKVNSLRLQRHIKPLNYDPALSLVAQQRADFGAAAHSGFATQSTVGPLPSSETNVWAEMAGVACSWERLFELKEGGAHALGPDPEIGFIENRAVDSQVSDAYLSPEFGSIGVGVEPLPDGNVSVVMDFVGRPKAGKPWSRGMPNLLGEVVGVGLPDCSW